VQDGFALEEKALEEAGELGKEEEEKEMIVLVWQKLPREG